jgi:hypothetical protein
MINTISQGCFRLNNRIMIKTIFGHAKKQK